MGVMFAIVIVSMRMMVAQQLATSPPTWNGSVQCQIDIAGPGYVTHQAHTWTLTGGLPADGGVLDYPGTWTVSGEGSRTPTPTLRTAGTWKTEGSLSGVRMAIFVRQSDQKLLVFLRHAQFNVPNGTTGSEQVEVGAARSQSRAIAAPVYEWRPFPVIEDVPASTHIMGSSTTPIKERLDASQPIGSMGQAVCNWDLVKGSTATAASTAVQAPAPRIFTTAEAGSIVAPPASIDTTTTRTRERAPLSPDATKALADAAKAIADAAAATSCPSTPTSSPCVTIVGPTAVAVGATGTYSLQFKNVGATRYTNNYPDGSVVTVETTAQVSFRFDVDGNQPQSLTQVIPASSGSTPSLSTGYAFPTAGAHTVNAVGSVTYTTLTTRQTPRFDATGMVRVGTDTTQTQMISTTPMSVRRAVNVTAP